MSGIIRPGDPRFNGVPSKNPGPQPPADPRPVVAVLVPSTDMVHADFMVALISMLWHSNNFARTLLLNFKGSAISFSRNVLAGRALEAPVAVDAVLFLDSDLVFPPDTLARLLRSGRSIVGATYARRKEPFEALGRLIPRGRDLSQGGIHEAEALPAGCLLIATSVFRQLKKPWFFETYDEARDPWFVSEDYGFCEKARAAGMTLWCDLTLSTQIGHIGQHAVQFPPLASAPPAMAEAAVDG